MSFDVGGLFYRPTVKDLVSGNSIVRRFFKQFAGVAAASATITVSDTEQGQSDLVRLIHGLTVTWTPGAAQTAVWANLAISPSGANSLISVSLQPGFAPAAAQQVSNSILGIDMPWMQGEVLTLAAVFNAGVANNNVGAIIWGWEFPRGSFQR